MTSSAKTAAAASLRVCFATGALTATTAQTRPTVGPRRPPSQSLRCCSAAWAQDRVMMAESASCTVMYVTGRKTAWMDLMKRDAKKTASKVFDLDCQTLCAYFQTNTESVLFRHDGLLLYLFFHI